MSRLCHVCGAGECNNCIVRVWFGLWSGCFVLPPQGATAVRCRWRFTSVTPALELRPSYHGGRCVPEWEGIARCTALLQFCLVPDRPAPPVVPAISPTVTILGTLQGGRAFQGMAHFCVFEIATGSGGWSLISGDKSGQTQLAEVDEGHFACWSHPVAVQFGASTLEDWPAAVVQVWAQDELRRNAIGATRCALPCRTATHALPNHSHPLPSQLGTAPPVSP